MKLRVIILFGFVFMCASCTHFVPISSSDVFADKYNLVTKIELVKSLGIEINIPDSNNIVLSDSTLIFLNDSTKIKIPNSEIHKYFKSEFSFGRTFGLTVLIIFGPLFLGWYIMSNMKVG